MKSVLFSFILLTSFELFAQRPSDMINQIPGVKDNSAFSDIMYSKMDWHKFFASELAAREVDPQHIDINLLNAAIFYASNRSREVNERDGLAFDPKLRDASLTHSFLMVKDDFFNHENPKAGPFQTLNSRAQAYGFIGESLGENIIKGSLDLVTPTSYGDLGLDVLEHVLTSPQHKEILLRPKFKLSGVGIYPIPIHESTILYFMVTQDFAAPWVEDAY